MILNLNQVTVPARNVVESTLFYRKLGLTEIVDSPHYARFECPDGESTFSIHLDDKCGAGAVVYFECEFLDEACVVLQQKGLQFDQLPQDESWLWREARLTDPAGNTICLYKAGKNRRNPPWRVEHGPL